MLKHLILVSILSSGELTQFLMRGIFATRNYAISLPRHPPGPPRITQPSDATDTAFSAPKLPPTLRQLAIANWPPPTDRHNTGTTSPLHYRPLSHSAQSLPAPSTWHSTKLKATFYLATTLATSIPPSDQRANHSATLTPRKFYLLNLRRFGWSTTFTVQMIRKLFSYITQPFSPHNQPQSKSNYSLITHILN